MLYFDHDTSAAYDDKIVVLRDENGGAAVDAYWTVLELIYRDETDLVFGENLVETKALARRLGLGFDQLKTFVDAFLAIGLLDDVATDEQRDEGVMVLHSKRASENIAAYNARKETARRNGSKGGRKPSANRTVTKSVSDGNRVVTRPETNKSKSKSKSKERDKRERAPEPPESSLKTGTEQPNDCATPTLDEVRAYFGANCLRGDPDLFWATYDAKGWVDGNGIPIVRWESQALRWSKRQVSMDSERAARGEPTEAEAKWRPAADEDPQAAYERAQAEYEEALAKLTPEERRRFNLG